MSRSKNPFPPTFLCTMWSKSPHPVKLQAEYVNGWYQLVNLSYPWIDHSSFRWSDIQRYVESGILVIEGTDDLEADTPFHVDLTEVL